MTTTWAGIVRVSHMGDRKQGDNDFHAERQQVESIEHGLPHGAKLAVLPPELDVSGGLPLERRPSLLAAVEGVEAGRYAGIIVAYLSRLGRNTREQLRAWDRVEAAGGRIICVQENIDTATPSGRFMRTVMLANAEREREEHAERFGNLRRWATDAGIWQARQAPRGYSKDPTTRRLVPNGDAPLVVRAFRDAGRGIPVRQIAVYLRITPAGARLLLANRTYLGELRMGPFFNPEAHPPIISGEDFAAAQVKRTRPPRSGRPVGLLSGIVRCAGCGYVMSRNGRDAYACAGTGGGEACPSPASISPSRFYPYVEAAILSELARLTAHASKAPDAKATRRAFREAEAELSAFVAHTSARTPGYGEGLARRQADFDTARDALNVASTTNGANLHVTWDDLDATERNRLAQAILGAVVVVRAGGRGANRPVHERVQIWREFDAPSGLSHGIRPLAFLDADNPNVIRVALAEDHFEDTRAAA